MDWYPFNLSEGQALSLEIDIGDPDVEVPEVQVTLYDADGQPIVDDGAVTALDAAAMDDDVTLDAGGALPFAAMVGEDQIWVGSDHVIAASEVVAAHDGDVESPAPWLFGDTLVIADSATDAEAVEHALLPESSDNSLTMSDVFGTAEGDISQAPETPAGSAPPGAAASVVDYSHGVVVVLGHEESEELY